MFDHIEREQTAARRGTVAIRAATIRVQISPPSSPFPASSFPCVFLSRACLGVLCLSVCLSSDLALKILALQISHVAGTFVRSPPAQSYIICTFIIPIPLPCNNLPSLPCPTFLLVIILYPSTSTPQTMKFSTVAASLCVLGSASAFVFPMPVRSGESEGTTCVFFSS